MNPFICVIAPIVMQMIFNQSWRHEVTASSNAAMYLSIGEEMFFRKNLPHWERLARACAGLMVIAFSLFYPLADWIKWTAIVSGIMVIGTGFIGFCPMCAMAGRRLKK
jgi:Protein of unknown function (DUF2892)